MAFFAFNEFSKTFMGVNYFSCILLAQVLIVPLRRFFSTQKKVNNFQLIVNSSKVIAAIFVDIVFNPKYLDCIGVLSFKICS